MADPLGRLDAELVRRGFARSRAVAQEAIDEGRVCVDGRPVAKASLRIAADAALEVTGDDGYVSRAAHKLVAALDYFQVDVAGRRALDVGASTGGFTQVLLERGIREVIALDVGHGQLVPSLRADARVRVVEGANARELTAESLAGWSGTTEPPTVVVTDVSFISLRQILPALVASVGTSADYVVLIKPQFEVGRQGIREGIVRDRGARHDAVMDVLWAATDLGMSVRGIRSSPVLGTNGNQEYLAHLSGAAGLDPQEWSRTLADLT